MTSLASEKKLNVAFSASAVLLHIFSCLSGVIIAQHAYFGKFYNEKEKPPTIAIAGGFVLLTVQSMG